ncbi:MAG: DUF2167 domain-containing protein [Planctomycetes bacterium]|nr:DUF2167 domain-containing protein [Planctomycetota bacterium]
MNASSSRRSRWSLPCLFALLVGAPHGAAQDGAAQEGQALPEGDATGFEELDPQLRAELEKELALRTSLAWQEGPTVGKLRDLATVRVPAGSRFVEGDGARKLLEHWGNLTDGGELGLVEMADEESEWQVLFEWADVGKVEDDEELDAEALFDQMKESEGPANEARKARGFEPLELVRFTTPPHYDSVTHNLEWGLLVRSPSGESINYQVKLLGRYGFMSATLLCAPEVVERVLPPFKELLSGFGWVEGKSYSEWKQGDPIAEFGITGLVVGGAAAAAWKFGLLGKLAKFGKFIAVAVLAGIGAIWKRISGRGKQQPTP